VKHWADGGATRLENLVLLCRRHHRAVHEEGFRVELGPDERPNFFTPRGMPLPEVPPAARTGEDPVAALIRRNHLRGLRPAYDTAGARYEREDDVPWAVTAAALEAIDP